MKSPILDAALDYVHRGIPVFPCRGKKPLTAHGFQDASCDEKQILNWWNKWPSANIGIPTGIASGLFVLDMDGDKGQETLKALEGKHGALPRTRTIITSPGHLQFWFQHPATETKSTAGVLGPGLDTRGTGGYVAAPPSIHPTTKKAYIVSHDAEPGLVPAWLIELTMRNGNGGKHAAAPTIAGEIPEGQRRKVLLSMAGSMRRRGAEVEEILAALREMNNRRCKPPLEESEVRAIAEDVPSRYQPHVEVGNTAPPPIESPEVLMSIADMPLAAMCGRLGEACQLLLPLSPVSYAWTAQLAVAGTMAHQCSKLRTNLFGALVGPKQSGKSTTIDNAIAGLGLSVDSPELERSMCGSAEGLLRKVGDTRGCARLYCPDELMHLFIKTQIDRASFAPVLQRCFYHTAFELVVAKGQRFNFNASLGILGGIVEDKFQECFGSATTAGLYDRFIFGLCPQPFTFDFQPFKGGAECLPSPVEVSVDPQVWEQKSEWLRTIHGMTGRVAENALRVATICAGFDGKKLLRVQDLGPALEFARYQIRVQALLQPNPGENPDARCAFAILRKIEESAPDGGFVSKRDIARAIHADRFGPGVFRRAGDNLFFNGEIETARSPKDKRIEIWRRL